MHSYRNHPHHRPRPHHSCAGAPGAGVGAAFGCLTAVAPAVPASSLPASSPPQLDTEPALQV